MEKNGRRYIAIQNVAKIISVVEALYAIYSHGMLGLDYVTKCWFHMRSVHHVSRRGWPDVLKCSSFFLCFFLLFFQLVYITVHWRIASKCSCRI